MRSLSMMTHQSSYPNLPSTNTHGSSSTQDGRASSSSSSAFDGGVNFGMNLGPLVGAPNGNNAATYKQVKDVGDSRLFDVCTGPTPNVASYVMSPYLEPSASSSQSYFPSNSEGDRRQYTMSNPRANGNEVLRTPS